MHPRPGLVLWLVHRQGRVLERGRGRTRQGAELDDNDADVHRILAAVKINTNTLTMARYHQERALVLNPNYDLVVVQQGELLTWLGNPQEGIEWIRKAMRLNPHHPERFWSHLARPISRRGNIQRPSKRLCTFRRWTTSNMPLSRQPMAGSEITRPLPHMLNGSAFWIRDSLLRHFLQLFTTHRRAIPNMFARAFSRPVFRHPRRPLACWISRQSERMPAYRSPRANLSTAPRWA